MLAMLLRGLGLDRKGDSVDAALARLWPHPPFVTNSASYSSPLTTK